MNMSKTVRGVDYYNDSKGTNPDAAIKGIGAMVKPTYLIGGGYDKQSEYDEWIESFGGKVRKLVLLGQTREKIADCAKKHGFTDYIFVDDLQQAVDYCAEHAKEGRSGAAVSGVCELGDVPELRSARKNV